MSHGFELAEELSDVRHYKHHGNGLEVLHLPTAVAPVVSFGIVYCVGSRNEGRGHTGATHYLEHLMFKGSKNFNRGLGTEAARVLQRVGANFNATTWLDRTNYYATVGIKHFSLAVDIESDRMRGALIRDEDVDSERTVILNEMERGENEPFDLLMKGIFAHAFIEHPYHHPTIGWRGDVEHLSADDLRHYYDTYYQPNNATVIVVGDVDETVVLEEVERGFGAIPAGPEPFPAVREVEAVQRGERRFQIRRAGEVASIVLSWRVPEGLHPDLPPLQVLTQILSEGVTSRLYQRLVETNLCLGVNAFAFELKDPGLFQIAATLAPGVDPTEVENVIRNEVACFRKEPGSDEETRRAKMQTRTDLAFQRESPAQIVSALTESVAMGDWRRYLYEMDRVGEVDCDDMLRVAQAHLIDDVLTVGVFIPEGSTNGRDGGAEQMSEPQPRPCYLHEPFAERVQMRDLPGGARLAVLRNEHTPTLTIAGSMTAGTACADDNRLGVPGLTAAMLKRGTGSHSHLELARELEDHGLQMGIQASSSSPRVVSLGVQGLKDEQQRMVKLLVEVLRTPVFPESELSKLREKTIGYLVREQQETFPLAFAALTRRLYRPGYPLYRRPIEERLNEVKAIVRDDLERFHRRVYGPSSLVLAAVGDVDADEIAAILSEALIGWKGGFTDMPNLSDAPLVDPVFDRINIEDRPNIDVLIGHRGLLRFGDDDQTAALLANACLGQSTLTSRLGLAVRDQAGLTYGIYSRFFGTLHVAGPWATFLSVSPDNLERAVELCREVVKDYVATGPSAGELADEQSSLAGSFTVGLATNGGVARELVTELTAGNSISSLDTYPGKVLGTTRDEVMTAIERHFDPERLVVVAAGSLNGG